MAIALSVVFALILYWRFAPSDTEVSPMVSSGAEETPLRFYAEDLRVILDQLESVNVGNSAEAPEVGFVNNPFATQDDAIRLIYRGETSETTVIREPNPSNAGEPLNSSQPTPDSRQRRLQSLNLTATFLSRDGSVAMINGRIVGPGESIFGFRVKSIQETGVTLEDAGGTAQLILVEDDY